MRADADADEQVAARRAATPYSSLAGNPNARPVVDPGRDVHRQALRRGALSLPAASTARTCADVAAAVATRAGASEGNRPLAHAHLPATAAVRARRHARRVEPAAGADRTRLGALDADRCRQPAHGIQQPDLQLGLEIGPAPRGGAKAAAAGPKMSPKTSSKLEYPRAPCPAEPAPAADCHVRASRARSGVKARLDARHPELVVELALFGIGENVVRFRDRLELLLGLGVPRIDVGMILAGELPVGLLDLVR